ncbi:G-type lectin S-receptor-like serine/threonine-protein kinase At1g11330 [Lycium barbarum]|uniref:G-type lectin S-receptor-like serine/threonine-protein kinase At1g11330 n=1 Tax=Lycium barbarum TaxID=112863 RepID=UPI00293E0268|nr:G-type lectin S-receptor-like serine/threonine-protein kinase At1g11330 [Lycium barbarum]
MLLGLKLCLRKWKQAKARKEQEIREILADIYDIRDDESGGTAVKVYSYSTILTASKCFSSECELGKGGFGCVYKGTMSDGQELAIKLLSKWSKQGLSEFKNELILIARLQHTNLVKLVGFCVHGDQKMLIYEYMPNKSLDFFLFDPNKRRLLPWERRFSIIEGIAQGLLYLHKYSRLRIVHRDLKASNILLDENMNPKISDFGMAKILKQNIPEDNTTRFAGTFGYMAPEYAKEGIFSTKSDVYSFGVLVLEIASGRKNNCFHNQGGPLNLVEYAWELWNTEAIVELIDPTVSDSCFSKEQVERAVHVGLLCVEECAADRPNIEDVISILNNTNIDLPKPKRPAFVSRFSVFKESQKDQTGKYSENGLSITTVQGR